MVGVGGHVEGLAVEEHMPLHERMGGGTLRTAPLKLDARASAKRAEMETDGRS